MSGLGSESPGFRAVAAKQDNLLVFDWDDTILPTSWLESTHALLGGGQPRPEIQRQLANLSAIASHTLTLASTLGTVVIITNSAPGWVDQSCQLLMPSLLQQVRSLNIVSRPMNAPLTFKINAFKRECRHFKNVISVGDGEAERTASLRLMTGSGPQQQQQQVKSIKLINLPTCAQLVAEHDMLQERLADVVGFGGNLDLKAKCPIAAGQLSTTKGSSSNGGGSAVCTLVTFSRAFTGKATEGVPTWLEDGGTAASSAAMAQMANSLSSGKMQVAQDFGRVSDQTSPSSTVVGKMQAAQVLANSRSLPPVGRMRPGGAGPRNSLERGPPNMTAAELDMLSIEGKVTAERGGPTNTATFNKNSTESSENLRFEAQHAELANKVEGENERGSSSAADGPTTSSSMSPPRSSNNNSPVGISNDQRIAWKMQSMTGGSSDRLSANRVRIAGFAKKKSVVVPGPSGRNSIGTAWREHSAPAGMRSNGISVARAWGDDTLDNGWDR